MIISSALWGLEQWRWASQVGPLSSLLTLLLADTAVEHVLIRTQDLGRRFWPRHVKPAACCSVEFTAPVNGQEYVKKYAVRHSLFKRQCLCFLKPPHARRDHVVLLFSLVCCRAFTKLRQKAITLATFFCIVGQVCVQAK